MKLNILKYVYKSFLAGFPLLTYNPLNTNNFISEYTIKPYSTYINYELDFNQQLYLSNYLSVVSNNLDLQPIRMYKDDENASYYISVNIYNCTSPLFSLFTNEPVTRCEINTYVINEKGEKGTLILDYCSNIISMDPNNIFKRELKKTKFIKKYSTLISSAVDRFFNLTGSIITSDLDVAKLLNRDLHKYTDNIFYINGVIDKLYYDSSLTHGIIMIPEDYNMSFKFMDINFDKPHSVFYFNDTIKFTGSMWDNLYSVNKTKI